MVRCDRTRCTTPTSHAQWPIPSNPKGDRIFFLKVSPMTVLSSIWSFGKRALGDQRR